MQLLEQPVLSLRVDVQCQYVSADFILFFNILNGYTFLDSNAE